MADDRTEPPELPPGWVWDPETPGAYMRDISVTRRIGAAKVDEIDAYPSSETQRKAVQEVADEAWRIHDAHPAVKECERLREEREILRDALERFIAIEGERGFRCPEDWTACWHETLTHARSSLDAARKDSP